MPHVIIEYTDDVVASRQARALVDAVFDAVVSAGLFNTGNIKLRTIPIKHYRLGSDRQGFIHVQCRIRRGRSEEQKKALTTEILSAIKGLSLGVSVVTVEVIDMDAASYAKYSP